LSRKFIIRGIAAILLYIAAASYLLQNETNYFFEKKPYEGAYSFPVDFQEINIDFNQNIKLHAVLFYKENSRGLVLIFPSGDYLSEKFNPQNNFFYNRGYSLILPEYRGNGKSVGNYEAESEFYSDAEQWYKLVSKMADTLPLLVYGQEFGAGMAAQLAANENPDLVVLENPAYSWNEVMLKKYFWWLPHSKFGQYKFPTWKFLRLTHSKVALIYTTQNKLIHSDHSLRLLEFLKPGDEVMEYESETNDQNKHEFQNEMNQYLIKNNL
jgi:hypothetical protein